MILGESGSGKTTLARAIVGLLPPGGRVLEGHVVFRGQDLTAFSEKRMQAIRGAEIVMRPQEPALALQPLMRAIDHVAEVVRGLVAGAPRNERPRSQTQPKCFIGGTDAYVSELLGNVSGVP